MRHCVLLVLLSEEEDIEEDLPTPDSVIKNLTQMIKDDSFFRKKEKPFGREK